MNLNGHRRQCCCCFVARIPSPLPVGIAIAHGFWAGGSAEGFLQTARWADGSPVRVEQRLRFLTDSIDRFRRKCCYRNRRGQWRKSRVVGRLGEMKGRLFFLRRDGFRVGQVRWNYAPNSAAAAASSSTGASTSSRSSPAHRSEQISQLCIRFRKLLFQVEILFLPVAPSFHFVVVNGCGRIRRMFIVGDGFDSSIHLRFVIGFTVECV